MDKRQRLQLVGAVLLILVAVGVLFWAFTRSDEEPMILSKASLQGKVTYRGKPVPHALIIVTGDQTSSTGTADVDGNYFVQYAPVGNVRIGVNTDAARGMMMGAIMSASMSGDRSGMPTFVDVPAKYFAPETSGISAEVTNKKGLNDFNIELK
jgi:hypothetical protein